MLTIIYNHLIWYCCAIIVPSHLMGLLQKMRRDESAHPRSDDRSAGPIRLPDLRRSTAQHGAHGEKMGLDFKEKMGKREVYEGYVRNTCSNWFYMRTFLLMLTYLLSFLSKETSLRTILFFLGGVGTTMTTTMGCPATSPQRGSRRSPNAVPTDPSPAIARTPRREVPGTATTQWRSQPGACMETLPVMFVGWCYLYEYM